ncbi:MAG: DNA cytosine methyltransferase [Terriglobales bacterium]|jgi:DNA (cytosine-5)-methyltransferase 1
MPPSELVALEICSGAGGQAAGLEAAGFDLAAAVEIDPNACRTLRANRPQWRVIESDIRHINGRDFRGVDLFAGGVPCPPFSIAGKQLGHKDERDLFPEALRLIEDAKPAAVLLENVPGFAMARFAEYRRNLLEKLSRLGYQPEWRVLNASSFGVSQLRPRFLLVAVRNRYASSFSWPEASPVRVTVGETLADLMAARQWGGVDSWRRKACGIAPTIVGGSKKHGGPDLGPTRAKRQWAGLSVDGLGIANEAPGKDFELDGKPRLTVRMVARLQGFSDDWIITGAKTAAYRQVGNAFPPPVAKAVGEAISDALLGKISKGSERQVPLFAVGY